MAERYIYTETNVLLTAFNYEDSTQNVKEVTVTDNAAVYRVEFQYGPVEFSKSDLDLNTHVPKVQFLYSFHVILYCY